MIRFQCPDCAKNLSVPDTNAGKIGVCPGCKCRIQLPDAPPAEDPDVVDDFVVDEPPPKPKASPIRRKEDVLPPARKRRPVEDDESPVEERPVRRQRAVAEYDDDEDGSPLEVEPVRRKKKKKKKKRRQSSGSEMFGGIDPYLIALAAVALLGVLSIIPALVFKPAILLPIIVGGLTVAVGRIWFLMIVFQDDSTQGMLCLVFGIYSLIYLMQNFEETKKPFFLELMGSAILMIGVCAGGATGG